MIDQSTATIRRLIDRRHLTRAPGMAGVRVPHASLETFLASGTSAPVNLARELKQNGPCLVLTPDAISRVYNVHVQTVYKMLSRGALPTVKWLWARRVLKSEITRVLGAANTNPGADDRADSQTGEWINQSSAHSEGSKGSSHTFFFRSRSA